MKTKVLMENLNLFYGDFQALKGVTMDIPEQQHHRPSSAPRAAENPRFCA